MGFFAPSRELQPVGSWRTQSLSDSDQISQNHPGALGWPHLIRPDFPLCRGAPFPLGTLARAPPCLLSRGLSNFGGESSSPKGPDSLYSSLHPTLLHPHPHRTLLKGQDPFLHPHVAWGFCSACSPVSLPLSCVTCLRCTPVSPWRPKTCSQVTFCLFPWRERAR